jgi:photosystem II stability/assembly factor-like uncharacterized protein
LNEKDGISTTSGKIFYTGNSGKSWNLSNMPAIGEPFGFDFINEKQGFFFGCRLTKPLTSSNSGKEWTRISDDLVGEFGLISFASSKTGWIASNGAVKLKMTDDGGKNWKEIILPENKKVLLAVNLRTEKDGYVLDNDLNLFKTTDGGNTWETIQLNLPKENFDLFDTDYNKAAIRFYNENNGEIFIYQTQPEKCWLNIETKDGGKTWNTIPITVEKGTVYITHDGNYLSIYGNNLTLLKRKKA